MLGMIDSKLIDGMRGSEFEKRLVADVERVALSYAEAMLSAQLMEFAVRIAGPALVAPLDDAEAARQEVEKGRRRKLCDAGDMLKASTESRFAAQLDSARAARNWLAHDFWLESFPRIVAGDAAAIVADLNGTRAMIEEVVTVLLRTVFPAPLDARGVTEDAMNGFVTALVAALMSGDIPPHLSLIDDADEILSTMTRLATDGNSLM